MFGSAHVASIVLPGHFWHPPFATSFWATLWPLVFWAPHPDGLCRQAKQRSCERHLSSTMPKRRFAQRRRATTTTQDYTFSQYSYEAPSSTAIGELSIKYQWGMPPIGFKLNETNSFTPVEPTVTAADADAGLSPWYADYSWLRSLCNAYSLVRVRGVRLDYIPIVTRPRPVQAHVTGQIGVDSVNMALDQDAQFGSSSNGHLFMAIDDYGLLGSFGTTGIENPGDPIWEYSPQYLANVTAGHRIKHWPWWKRAHMYVRMKGTAAAYSPVQLWANQGEFDGTLSNGTAVISPAVEQLIQIRTNTLNCRLLAGWLTPDAGNALPANISGKWKMTWYLRFKRPRLPQQLLAWETQVLHSYTSLMSGTRK